MAAMMALSGGGTVRAESPTFADDVAFLKRHAEVIVLGEGSPAQAVVCPAYQGRVMTSTLGGPQGTGFGWINRELIASGKTQPHINVWGGEDRFWMGPEGGQFAIFFKNGDPFDLAHWQTPAVIDTEAYEVAERGPKRVTFRKRTKLTNYSGTTFDVLIEREVRLLDSAEMVALLGVTPGPQIKAVGFQSQNRLTNAGSEAWTRAGGLLSVWILGMFKPAPRAVVMIPFVPGDEAQRGPIVNDAYFGKVPAERLKVGPDFVLFRGDGQHRSKIGLSPRRARPVAASVDLDAGTLTIVQYNQPAGPADYVNSMWEVQKEPYAGDVVNSYNDGPLSPGGKPLGPFYELETSSPAAALKPGESITHVHRTFHFAGPRAELDRLARAVVGVSLDEAESFAKK